MPASGPDEPAWFGPELLQTVLVAEVVGLAVIFSGPDGCVRRNRHPANRIDDLRRRLHSPPVKDQGLGIGDWGLELGLGLGLGD